jgi:hypothetical protein
MELCLAPQQPLRKRKLDFDIYKIKFIKTKSRGNIDDLLVSYFSTDKKEKNQQHKITREQLEKIFNLNNDDIFYSMSCNPVLKEDLRKYLINIIKQFNITREDYKLILDNQDLLFSWLLTYDEGHTNVILTNPFNIDTFLLSDIVYTGKVKFSPTYLHDFVDNHGLINIKIRFTWLDYCCTWHGNESDNIHPINDLKKIFRCFHDTKISILALTLSNRGNNINFDEITETLNSYALENNKTIELLDDNIYTSYGHMVFYVWKVIPII